MSVCPRPCSQPAPLSCLLRLQLPQFIKAKRVVFQPLTSFISVINELLPPTPSRCHLPLPVPAQQSVPRTFAPLGPDFTNIGTYAELCPSAKGRLRGHGASPSPAGCTPRDSAWNHRVRELLCAGRDRVSCGVGQGDGCRFRRFKPLDVGQEKTVVLWPRRCPAAGALPSRQRCRAPAALLHHPPRDWRAMLHAHSPR